MNQTAPLSSISEQTDLLYSQLNEAVKQELVAKQFLKHCIKKPKNAQEKTCQFIPHVETVAEALIKNSQNGFEFETGVKAVQLYLQSPTSEYFGETLIRLNFLTKKEVDELISIKPAEVEFGSFLIGQGMLTPAQRDMAVMSQKRLFTISEVFKKVTKAEKHLESETTIIDTLKNFVSHFQTTTKEIEDAIHCSHPEDVRKSMGRLENIVRETESSTHIVLDLLDSSFKTIDNIAADTNVLIEIAENSDGVIETANKILESLELLKAFNSKINNTQAIQDRIGQQLLKIIPVLESVYNLLQDLSSRLRLDIEKRENPQKEDEHVKNGYGTTHESDRIENQADVDALLSNLGL